MSIKTLAKKNTFFPGSFDDFFKPWNEWFTNGNQWPSAATVPAVNITENTGDYTLTVAAPGLTKDDFKVDVDSTQLVISVEKETTKEEKEKKYARSEYNYSSFCRSFALPDNVIAAKIEASYHNGELTVVLPKNEAAKKAGATTHIDVKG